MIRALTLLTYWQIRNGVRTSFTDPRKLIPLLILLASAVLQVVSFALLVLYPNPLYHAAQRLLVGQMESLGASIFLMLALIVFGVFDYAFTGGFLAFPMADVDYLFPAPVSRRLVLAYRVGTKTLLSFVQGAFFLFFFILRPLQSLAREPAVPGSELAALGGLFFCIGGYVNLALALKLVLGFRESALLRRVLLVALVVTVVLLLRGGLGTGLEVVRALGQHPIAVVLFYPCRLAADVALTPLNGRHPGDGLAFLALFYAVTLLLVFGRQQDFYEASLVGSERTARVLQAAREQNWAAVFAIQSEEKSRKRTGGKERGRYTLPAFGRGAGSLLWAHLAAAAKRPFLNFGFPLLAGCGLAAGAVAWLPQVAVLVVGAVASYLTLILTASGIPAFHQSLLRQPLIRPLPFPAWQLVLAEIMPRVLYASLFGWGAGGVLLWTGVPHSELVGALLVCSLPFLLAWLSVMEFTVAMWYPDPQDKVQQLIGALIALFFTGLIVGVVAPFLIVPVLLGAPVWAAAAATVLPCVTGTAGAVALAQWVYRRYEPAAS